MKDIYRHLHGFAEPDDSSKSSPASNQALSLRDRWESVRYGPVGRFLGYSLAFALSFAFIFLLIWFLEHGGF